MWVKGTLRYLLDTSTVGFISGGPTPGPKLLGYADAGFADCTVTRRSRGGFVFLPLSGTMTVAFATANHNGAVHGREQAYCSCQCGVPCCFTAQAG